jgi:hypothetical protein
LTHPLLGLSAEASLHRARGRGGIHRLWSVPGRRVRISRCRPPALRIARIFTVKASACPARRSMLATPLAVVRRQRLLTSCALSAEEASPNNPDL